jgi:hypothetical protein
MLPVAWTNNTPPSSLEASSSKDVTHGGFVIHRKFLIGSFEDVHPVHCHIRVARSVLLRMNGGDLKPPATLNSLWHAYSDENACI